MGGNGGSELWQRNAQSLVLYLSEQKRSPPVQNNAATFFSTHLSFNPPSRTMSQAGICVNPAKFRVQCGFRLFDLKPFAHRDPASGL